MFEPPVEEAKNEIINEEMADLNSNEVAVEKPKADKKCLTKPVNITLNKLPWPLDEDLISSITEDSSGSSYVR